MEKNEVPDQLIKVSCQNLPPSKARSRSRGKRVALPRLRIRQQSKNSDTPIRQPEKSQIEKSLSIGIKYYKLPDNYPERFSTYSSFKNANGERIPLIHRDLVESVLTELDREVQPLMKKFKLHYAALSENHPLKGKAAMTFRIPLKFYGPNAFAHHIKLRVRSQKAPNDPKKFYNKSTLLAVLFHEIAHIRQMDHGKKFMFLLRDIYRFAAGLKLFPKGEEHMLPSCKEWENLIFKKKGNVTYQRLLEIYENK